MGSALLYKIVTLVLCPPLFAYCRFTCKWCDLAGTECLVLIKPPKFEAMVDAFLNLMWEKRRKEYKVCSELHSCTVVWVVGTRDCNCVPACPYAWHVYE